jgi:hypothetical protein
MRQRIFLSILLASCSSLSFAAGPATTPAALPFTISKDTTCITTPLRPDGTPDYLAALNDKYGKGVTPDQNALIPFLQIFGTGSDRIVPESSEQALKLLGVTQPPPDHAQFQSFDNYLQSKSLISINTDVVALVNDAHKHLWTADQDPLLADYLQSQAPSLDLAVQASSRSHWFYPFVSQSGSLHNLDFYHYQGYAQFGDVLLARAMLRASSGNIDGAASDLRAAKRIARLLASDGIVLSNLLSIVWEERTDEAIVAILCSAKLTEKQCDTLSKTLDLPPIPSMVDTIDTAERWLDQEILILKATGHLPADTFGNDTSKALFDSIDVAAIDWDTTFKIINKLRDEQAAILRLASIPNMQQRSKALRTSIDSWGTDLKDRGGTLKKNRTESSADYSERVAHALISRSPINAAARGSVAYELRRRNAVLRADMLRLLVTAAKIKAARGAWPQSIESTNILMDPYAVLPVPVHYVVNGDSVLIYSVGLNQIDEAGGGDDIAIRSP